MTTVNVINPKSSNMPIDVLKFHLIKNNDFPTLKDAVSLEELIEYLIESLEDADAAGAARAENLLVRIGKPVVPFLIKGLKSSSTTVKSVCAMSLIRIGQAGIEPLKEFYVRNINRPKIKWVVEFILAEMGELLPAVDTMEDELPLLSFELTKVG